MQWFGQPWQAEVCDVWEQVETPVGKTCAHCEEPIGEHDKGIVVPVNVRYTSPGSEFVVAHPQPIHVECVFLSYMGHDHGHCECNRPANVTRREWALAFWRSAWATFN